MTRCILGEGAKLISVPEHREVVTVEPLKRVADLLPEKPENTV